MVTQSTIERFSTLSNKLKIGFGLMLVFVIIVGVEAFSALSSSTKGFNGYREMARDTNLAGRVQANMLMIRMNVKDFLITNSDKDKQQFEEYWGKTQQLMQQAQAEIEKPSRAAIVDQVDESLKVYRASFEKVVALIEQRHQLVNGSLNTKGPLAEQKLTEIIQSAGGKGDTNAAYRGGLALRSLLLGQLHAGKFLNTNDPAVVKIAADALIELSDQMYILEFELSNPDHQALVKEVGALADEYLKDFKRVVELINSRNDIVTNSLDVIGPEIAKNIEELKLDIRSTQDTIGPQLVEDNESSILIIEIVVILCVISGIAIAFLTTRSILNQMGGEPAEVIEVAKRVAKGELEIDLANNDAQPNSLYASIKHMINSLQQKSDLAAKIANSDLRADISLASDNDSLGRSLSSMKDNLSNIIAQVQNSAGGINQSSNNVLGNSDQLVQGMQKQAESVDNISASLEQLSAQTNLNAGKTQQASDLASTTQNLALNGQTKMDQLNAAMAEIESSGQSISTFINSIDEIAAQTNLLALNAAIEAARAGEQGRGFAVVADEVRGLAARSTAAAEETKKLVALSTERTSAGSAITAETSAALQEIIGQIDQTVGIISEISEANNEQAQAVEFINQAVSEVDSVIQEILSVSEQNSEQASSLVALADKLKAMLSEFKL